MAGDVKKRGRDLNSVVAWINSKPPQPLTEHEQKIERRWRRWVKRLRRLARRSLAHEYRARKYRSSILATAWRRLARRFLHINRRHHLSLAIECVHRLHQVAHVGSRLLVCHTAHRMGVGCEGGTRGVHRSSAYCGCADLAVLETAAGRDVCRDIRLQV